ncbi:MAG: MFS transporter [Hydrogenophaga sp.]
MTSTERRASASLAAIFALRMLGLFLVLPVFALEAARLPGGDDATRVGWAMGLYGLTQALLQIPFGVASDRLGRKPTIVVGLLVFALGSAVAAWAPDLTWLAVGRALQGAGAISAAVTAFLADVTRDGVRTKAMAIIGGSIALMFASSLVLAPLLAGWVGLSGIFALTTGLALLGIAVVIWWAPSEPVAEAPGAQRPRTDWGVVLRDPALLRLNFGVFVLHAVQLAMWMAVPAMLVQAGLSQPEHWRVYLPAVLVSLLLMGGLLFPMERRGYLRGAFLFAVALLVLVQLALWALVQPGAAPSVWTLGGVLLLFFTSFNMLEASQPSLVSRLAPTGARGAALGLYNTLQSLGFFVGGALGGWLVHAHGPSGLFVVCAVAALLWLLVAWPMSAPAPGRD